MLPSLQRDTSRLASHTFDLLVIGGGIYGLTIACDAAQRGLSVALVERNDFGSGTSFNHLRTIHGGLRYLQTLDLARARESIRERRALARVAPWAVQVMPFVLPLTRSVTRGRAAMRAAFLLDALLSSDRNEDVPEQLQLPAGRVIDRREAAHLFPHLDATTMTGAAVWHDYVATEADRLTLGWAFAAAAHGAVLANYVEASALTAFAGGVTGARVVDRTTGESIEVTSRTVVNATGSHLNDLLAPFGAQVTLPLLQAINVVTNRPAQPAALGGRSSSGRNLFLVPWRGRALFGTWESPFTCAPGDTAVRPANLSAFIAELNEAFPSFGLRESDITLIHRGVVPAQVSMEWQPTLDGRELVFEHRADGLGGAISVAGTKYTTARAVAERIVDRLFAYLGRDRVGSISSHAPLPHVDLDGEALLEHAAEREMVVTLEDAVVRRTPIGALGCPDAHTLSRAAAIVGAIRGWSESRQRDEIAALRRLY